MQSKPKNMPLRQLAKRLLALMPFLWITSFAPTAHADTKVFPGTICQVWGGDRHLIEFISYSQYGRITNTHPTERIAIVCPLMRDRPDRRMDLSVYWGDAYVGDGANNTGVLSCRFRSNSVWGKSSNASLSANSNNWDEAQYYINQQGYSEGLYGRFWWNNLFAFTDDVLYTSTYTLFCRLPPLNPADDNQSFIGSITIVEN